MSQELTYDSDLPDAEWDSETYTWDDERNETMPDPKVTYAVEEVLGFSQSTTDMVTGYKQQMIAKGVDPTAVLALLATARTDLSAKNTVQEGIKTQLRDQTPLVEAARDTVYAKAGNLCDMVITAFGRNSEQAQEATNLRKKLTTKRASPAAKQA